ncbi:hypothetical protein CWI84_03720 [Idiomarina tyrosinivorans]|uniref:Band 7 domain-containing protein n=1 Tax=Idiomarina tyrosinivorans TaxID=1445662 RepID=A0A432ZS56_9GAMM|nr:SPFH domain-containing protein [Idiomarina tyrosinivorans]RUO80703.1 hypothetical protein CWI84_03720 [Idiomarina tyrosinivorans]
MNQYEANTYSGYMALVVFPLLIIMSLLGAALLPVAAVKLVLLVVAAISAFCLIGFFMVNPNEGRVIQLFGDYRGTATVTGLRWANPLFTKRRVSLRVRNFESGRLKVNDFDGNPIEIAAVIVWKVVDSAEAVFEVDDYESFVAIQSEAALRNLATSYPYDGNGETIALRSHANEISDKLKDEVQGRLAKAGVEVLEARISHLAYAAEIAGAMLQRQQASAIVAARAKIVEGAVGMVESALQSLAEKHVVELDPERRAAMVSNLLVVLCGDQKPQAVINTGSLYQ